MQAQDYRIIKKEAGGKPASFYRDIILVFPEIVFLVEEFSFNFFGFE